MAQTSTTESTDQYPSSSLLVNGTSNNDASEQQPPAAVAPARSPIIPPPYWQDEADFTTSRSRASSRAAGHITLVDNTIDDSASHALACWARSAQIDSWTIVEGALGSIGSYVVFNCVIETTNGSTFKINKRYSEFDTLHSNLVTSFPNSRGAIPPIPAKSAFYKFQTKFLDKRKDGLEYFLHNVICNPEFAASPVLKDFLFA